MAIIAEKPCFEPDVCQLSRKQCMIYVLSVCSLFLCELFNLPDNSMFLQFLSLFYSAFQFLDVRQIQWLDTLKSLYFIKKRDRKTKALKYGLQGKRSF